MFIFRLCDRAGPGAMDISRKKLDDPNMARTRRHAAGTIPTYGLYGENRAETPNFWLHFETLPDRSRKYRWEIDLHRHSAFFQIFNITAGTGEAVFDDGRHAFSAPSAIFIPVGAAHGFSYSPDSDGTVLTAVSDRLTALAGSDRRLATFLAVPQIVPLAGTPSDAAMVATHCLARIADELDGRAAGRMAMVDALLAETLISLARATPVDAPQQGWTADRDMARIEELSALIDAYFREHRPVGFYAERLGISPTHLNRVVRRLTRVSVQAMINRKLVAEARRELVFTHMAVKSVAYSLGFSDPAYFSRFFHQQTGATPGGYRREERQKLTV
jgi:AraC family transcriptional activator of pobA